MPKPLHFVSSTPRNGATNVSTSLRTITLRFDKNVVNDAVWENNKTMIRMFRGSTRIAVRVTRIPDTVDFSKRKNIYVHPVAALRPFTTYRVVILPGLESKAGDTLGETVTIRFTTEAEE
jgi:hypothetical protein